MFFFVSFGFGWGLLFVCLGFSVCFVGWLLVFCLFCWLVVGLIVVFVGLIVVFVCLFFFGFGLVFVLFASDACKALS